MGFPNGEIKISSNFELNVNKPLDARNVVTNFSDLSNISFKYAGMLVYVTVLDELYVLKNDLVTWDKIGKDSTSGEIIGDFLPLAGGTMGGILDMDKHEISNVGVISGKTFIDFNYANMPCTVISNTDTMYPLIMSGNLGQEVIQFVLSPSYGMSMTETTGLNLIFPSVTAYGDFGIMSPYANRAKFNIDNITTDVIYNFPDKSGTVAMLSDIIGSTSGVFLPLSGGTMDGVIYFDDTYGLSSSSSVLGYYTQTDVRFSNNDMMFGPSTFSMNTESVNNKTIFYTYDNFATLFCFNKNTLNSSGIEFWENFTRLSAITPSSDSYINVSGSSVDIKGGTTNVYKAQLTTTLLTQNNIFEFPDQSGTLALLSDIGGNTSSGSGLSMNVNAINLGGTLTIDTTIDGANTYDFNIQNTDEVIISANNYLELSESSQNNGFWIDPVSIGLWILSSELTLDANDYKLENNHASTMKIVSNAGNILIDANADGITLNAQSSDINLYAGFSTGQKLYAEGYLIDLVGYDVLRLGTISGNQTFEMTNGSGGFITDIAGYGGLRYSGDYSASFVDRSLVDKEYVDSVTSNINETYYVSVQHGSDVTGQKGNILKPFKTIKEAVNQSTSGDVIHVFAGIYDEYSIPTKSYLTIHLEDGVRIIPTFNGGTVTVFSDLVLGQPAYQFRITGKGEILGNGQAGNDTTSLVASYSNSKYYIEAKRVRSMEAWGQVGAFIYVKNALIDFEAEAYSGGELYFENCSFVNYSSILYAYSDTLGNNPYKYTFKNCYFERNGVNYDYLNTYGTSALHVLYIAPAYPSTQHGNIIFDNCDFVQKVMNQDIMYIQSTDYDSSSGIQFNNCKFYNIDNTKKSIVFTTNGYTYVPIGVSQSDSFENGNLKMFFINNISNVDVDNVNTIYPMINQLPTQGFIINPYFKLNTKYITS